MQDTDQQITATIAEALAAPTAQDTAQVRIEDFGRLSSEPMLKFSEAAAVHIEQIGHEIFAEGQRILEECQRLANDIRAAARVQADAIHAGTDRTRKAALALTAVRDEFRNDITREIEARNAIVTAAHDAIDAEPERQRA